MAAVLVSTLPLVNRLLTIAQTEAAKLGHVVGEYSQRSGIFSAECTICHATVRITCTAHKYERVGSAYQKNCKPG